MSLDGKWRCLKIVEGPISRENEIIGGLKNALDRGSTIENAKQSFVNAGYKPEEVENAIQKVPSIISRVSKPLASPKGEERDAIQQPGQPRQEILLHSEEKQKKKASPGLTIALIVMIILVIGGGAALYFFRDQLFP